MFYKYMFYIHSYIIKPKISLLHSLDVLQEFFNHTKHPIISFYYFWRVVPIFSLRAYTCTAFCEWFAHFVPPVIH